MNEIISQNVLEEDIATFSQEPFLMNRERGKLTKFSPQRFEDDRRSEDDRR